MIGRLRVLCPSICILGVWGKEAGDDVFVKAIFKWAVLNSKVFQSCIELPNVLAIISGHGTTG